MSESISYESAVAIPNAIHKRAQEAKGKDGDIQLILDARDEAILRYRAMFSQEHRDVLGEEEFRQFLQFRNN